MDGPWLLGSALVLLLVIPPAAVASNVPALPGGPSSSLQDPPNDAAFFGRGPPAFPSSPPDTKMPETILQLSGSTSVSACADLQELFSDLLDSGNIFSRNQLCYLSALDSTDAASTRSGQNQSTSNGQGRPLFWFILSAVLPSLEVADSAVLYMGHGDGPDIDTFLTAAGTPCDDQLIATTQTEDQDSSSVFVYSCNGMLSLPGGAVPLTLPALCCTSIPKPPRQASPPLPPAALPPWIEEVEPPPTEPPRAEPPWPAPSPPPSPLVARSPPPPPGSTDRAQLTLSVMAPPDRLYCSKLLMACETLAQPYGLAYGNYSCRASHEAPAAEARYGATVALGAKGTAVSGNSSAAVSSSYVIVKAAWAARAYSRSFKRLQSALASSIDVFASLGLVPCGTEIRALLLGPSGGISREDVFGCLSSLPVEYQTALVQRGLKVLPRPQLCCRPPPPPGPPPLPPPRPPPPPRRPPQGPPAKPTGPPSPPAGPVPELQSPPASYTPPAPLPADPLSFAPGEPGGGWGQPPPESKEGSVYGEIDGGVPASMSSSTVQASKSFQSQGLSREVIAVITVLAAAAVLSILAVLFVLYRRRQSPLHVAAAAVVAAGLPPIIGYSDDYGGGAAASGAPQSGQHPRYPRGLGGWSGKDGHGADVKVQAGRGGGLVREEEGSGSPGGAGVLLTVSGSVGSSSVMTEQSSVGEGLPALMREATSVAAGAGTRAGPYGSGASLDFRDGDIGDTVAVVRTYTSSSQRQLVPAPAAASAGMGMPPAGWAHGLPAPNGSGFGFMDVFRGAAANHICLSAATSAAPSAAGVLSAAGVAPRGGNNAPPLTVAGGSGSDTTWRRHDEANQLQRRQDEGNDNGHMAVGSRPTAACANSGAAAAPTHRSEQQHLQHADYGPAGVMALQPREVTLLDLFKQSPLAGAMLSTPSTSSGGAPPSPPSLSRSLSMSRRPSGGGAGGAAAAAAARLASLDGPRQRSSPAVALERLSVQLAWNIARLSASVEGPGGGDEDDADPDGEGQRQGRDDARQNRGRRRGGFRGPVSGPQPRLQRWTSSDATMAPQAPGAGNGDYSRAVGGAGGLGAGSGTASEAPASGFRSSGTSGIAATSSVGPSSGWESGLSPEASSSSPAPPAARPDRQAALATGGARPAALAAATPGAGGGGGGVDLDISPKELRIQTDGLLGAGAFGSVYRGSYRGQPVAIKVLHHLHFAGGGGDGAAGGGGGLGGGGGALLQQKDVDSFRQEIAILRMLAHPNIVRVLGGCAHAGHPFLVMELMPRCLHNVIHGAAGSRLALSDALRIATDVARGLAHLHPAIVHRDLKPANILLDANGTAKISDFGLARYHLKPYISTQQPDAGSVAYMAPEGFDPAIGRLSAKCDVYSFGVLLWELITKQHPWAGESNVAIIYRVAVHRMRLPVPTDLRVCPPRLAALLDGCMSYVPSERPNMRHVLSELETMLRLVQEGGMEALLAAGPPAGPIRPEAAAPSERSLPAPPLGPPLQARTFEASEGVV